MTTAAGVQFKHPPRRNAVTIAEAIAYAETVVTSDGLSRFALTVNIMDNDGNVLTVTDVNADPAGLATELWSLFEETEWNEGTPLSVVVPGGTWRDESDIPVELLRDGE